MPHLKEKVIDYELYDDDEDPLETRNIASERPEVMDKLKAILATHPEAMPNAKLLPMKQ